MIRVGVLGEFQASYEGRVIALQPMQSIVISALLCAGEVVSRDRLAELVWNPPTPGSDKTLRTHLSNIAKSVEAAGGDPEKLVVSVPMVGGRRGYRLAEGLDIDAVRFRQLVSAGCEALRQEHFETADTLLAEALSLRKRGEPLLQAEKRPFAVVYVERLEEDYKNAVIGSFKTGITLGRHREVVGELLRFARRWPGERELQSIHVHALYRSNREQEAVAVCRQVIDAARAAGIDERSWQDLQRDVLRGALPRSGPLMSPAPAAA